MRIFAIGDTHLSRGRPKPMDVFGPHWLHHDERIRDNWNAEAHDDDLLLIAGDISWAMRLEEALPDLAFLAEFRGRKLLLKGNHDYWWGSLGRIQKAAPAGISFLQNDAVIADGVAIAGARGWTFPSGSESADDRRIYDRELQRLDLSLAASLRQEHESLLVMTHYPPLRCMDEDTSVSRRIERAGAAVCVYGHLHGPDIQSAAQGLRNGVDYRLVSADAVDFLPRLVWPPVPAEGPGRQESGEHE